MFDHIVIPVDGSDEAKYAARRGIQLAQRFDATVDVIHIVDEEARELARTSNEESRLRERGEEILAEIEEIASEIGRPISTELVTGKPKARICEFVGERNATLIVIGRQGMTGFRKRLLGGVTEYVLHRSDIPILVVPVSNRTIGTDDEYANVLLPTDGSENAEVAVQPGITIAQQYKSTIHVLNVVDLQAAGGVFNAGGLEKEFIERLEERGREAVERVANGIDETVPDVDVTTAIERTYSFDGAAAGICEYLTEHDIDMIVMGSHGRSNLKRQLLGSVTSTVLKSVDVPVLVVKRPA